ncbi:transcription antitermination factor NusB [Spongiivirga citrea]|uniref:Transcription antitermination factor NusB n=2 Tax=Spongiivirga citrea TaxID=1481457 RepID=A0A6M0CE20_9FLAO|nr:transcription antitermination factor NusB [Spongiivirga citrea]
MQSVYAFQRAASDDLKPQEKFLTASMDHMYDLYLLMLNLLVEVNSVAESQLEKIQKKYTATEEEKNPSRKFIENELVAALHNDSNLMQLLEDRKLRNWKDDDEYVRIIYDAIIESDLYKSYLKDENQSYKDDRNIILDLYKEVIAPNDKLYDYLEDKKLTWLDDLPLVNTMVLKTLRKIEEGKEDFRLPKLFKDDDDRKFAIDLFRKTILNEESLGKEIEGKTPNWDKERIAQLDAVLLRMAICEFTKFPSIPVKVTINEYLEVAKEYSTPKSSVFINGILDKLVKEYQQKGTLNKVGRGLM